MASSKKLQYAELSVRLENSLKQYLRPGQRVLLGLSGGLDSTVLLHLLVGLRASFGIHLEAFHVNHCISPRAFDWEQFCKALCVQYDVPYAAQCVMVPRDSGLGLEAAARKARYTVLFAQPVEVIVLAHHRDDQAETLLLQLLRGAGVKGLAGMGEAAEQVFDARDQNSYLQDVEVKKTILRPLLDVSRATLANFAMTNNLRWIEDESNLDLAYDRNFLRHHILPELEKHFPAARITLARSAAHMAEAAGLLEEIARQDAVTIIHGGRVSIEELRQLSDPRARNLLRFWLSARVASLPNTRRLQEIHRQLLTARPDRQVCIAVDGGHVRRFQGQAWFAPLVEDQVAAELAWKGELMIELPAGILQFSPTFGKGISRSKIDLAGLCIGQRQGGERFRPDCKRPTRNLRQLFQESGVPLWERRWMPFLYVGNVLVMVPGIGIACEFQATGAEDGLEIAWTPRF